MGMSLRFAGDPLAGVVVGMRRLTLALLTMSAAVAAASLPASASPVAPRSGMSAASADDRGPVRNGNGVKNRNYSAVRSPTIMHGQQQVSISISGKTNTQSALCNSGRHACNISQRIRTSHRW
ncbi:hypothetical protein GCM10023194_30330 [Planotetraspora phitsanulokensis]|uniref:Uncharacterized protein n=3 Tax=Planotetraspora phitsanulokensis TaxID=575192 RepID=A0A8J3U032_9ACTN|nr:hypothetical protein Pph01_08320 [Planotetraspora phitsanulokensis]